MKGEQVDLSALIEGSSAVAVGIEHDAVLLRFAEAVLGDDERELAAAREALHAALGDEAFVDAAAVVGNFQRMVRIADGTGIPLDAPLEIMTQDLREDLDLSRFGSSSNTPTAGRLRRAAGRVLRPIAMSALRRLGGDS